VDSTRGDNMKQITMILIGFGLCISAFAGDLDILWSACIRYDYAQQLSTNVPTLNSIASRDDEGHGVITVRYTSTAKAAYAAAGKTIKTKAQLAALDAAARTWAAAEKKDNEADPENMDTQLKAVVKMLCKWINNCVPPDKQKSRQEIIQAIKDEL